MKIWAKSPELGDFEIRTCSMLRENGRLVAEIYFSDPKENRALMDWFFEQSRLIKKTNEREAFLDSLFCDEAGEDVEDYIAGIWRKFDDFEIEDGEYYLGRRKSGDFVNAADALCKELPGGDRELARLRVAANLLLLSRLPEELPRELLRAIMAPWKKEEDVIELKNDTIFPFDWRGLPDKPLKACVLSNGAGHPLELMLKSYDGKYDRSITLPTGGRMSVCFAGKVICSLKGAVRINSGRAAVLSNEGLRLSLPGGDTRLYEDTKPIDCELHPGGRLHLLGKGGLRVTGGDGREKLIEDAVSVCALGTVWVGLKSDGSTVSNCADLASEKVCALVKNEKSIFLLRRDGLVISLDEGSYTPDQVVEFMMKPFSACSDDMAEELSHRGKRLGLGRDGNFVFS